MTKMNKDLIWIDALEFSNNGGWVTDTQFAHLMGSGYLLAAGEPGVAVEDAETEVEVNDSGYYRVWVRTRNWIKDYAPGKFKVAVNGVSSSKICGTAPSDQWIWEIAGDFQLSSGKCKIALCDISGYFARCAAVIITNDWDYVPPRPVEHIWKERARIKGISCEPQQAGEYDVIVVGGGPAGVPAAVASTRLGSKTAIIHNRPVLGGNSSTEAGVGFNGASARQPNAREGGIAEEIMRIKHHDDVSWTKALEILTGEEDNLSIYYDKHVIGVDMESEGKIASVTAIDTRTGMFYRFKGKLFIDCSGDGWLGYYAGANYRIGREAAHEYNESMAPQLADSLTMSGCLMGNGGFKPVNTGVPVKFTPPAWIPKLPEGDDFGRNINAVAGHWWVEAPNDLDDLWEAEEARDELIKINLAFFDYLKNSWVDRKLAENYKLVSMPVFDAKRESRRFIGDYILNENDCVSGRNFEDTIAHAGWPIDLHHPRGIFSGKEGPFFSNAEVPLVHIPYRCLYSVNIDNLLFAGRNASVTHVALGTVRVQNTLAALGQAAGTAAALCLEHHTTPRGIYQKHLFQLQQTLIKNDQYIISLKNEDPEDVARTAIVRASSVSNTELCVLRLGKEGSLAPLDRNRAAFFPRHHDSKIDSIFIKLASDRQEPVEITAHIREQADPDGFVTPNDLKTVKAVLQPKSEAWIEFKVDCEVKVRYIWVWFERMEGISWRKYDLAPLDWAGAEQEEQGGKWKQVKRQSCCVLFKAPDDEKANCSPENVINGYSRIHDSDHYAWVSDPDSKLPQWLELTFHEPVDINTVYLTFDTDMNNPSMITPNHKYVPQCVKDYELCAFDGTRWIVIACENDNFQRRRIHRFDSIKVEKLKVIVNETGGDPSARIFEVRAYKE